MKAEAKRGDPRQGPHAEGPSEPFGLRHRRRQVRTACFDFLAHCCLFEALAYHTVTLEMVCLIPEDTPVLQLPPALWED